MKKIVPILFLMSLGAANGWSQFDYFNTYKPFGDWIQLGGAVQIENTPNGYKLACSPDLGGGKGFGILNVTQNGEYLNHIFYETLGQSSSPFSDAFKLIDYESIYCGDRENNQWVVKFDENDEIVWEYLFPYNFNNDEIFSEFLEVSDGLLFPGRMSGFINESNSLFILKTHLNGDSMWMNLFNPELISYGSSDGIILDSEENIILSVYDPIGNSRALMKIQSNGEFIDSSENYFFYNQESVIQYIGRMNDENSGIVTIAYTEGDSATWNGTDLGVNYRFCILQFDVNAFEPVGEPIIFPTMHTDHEISDFLKTPDGGYAIAGTDWASTPVRGFIKKLTPDFTEEWMKYYEYDFEEPFASAIDDFEITEDGGFICGGVAAGFNGGQIQPQNIWILKLDACGDTEWQGCTQSVSELASSQFSVYPNPAQDLLTLELDQITFGQRLTASIRNALGQEVFSQNVHSYQTELDVSVLSRGVYVLSLVGDGRELSSKRIVIE